MEVPSRVGAACGIVAPATFVGAWVVGGARTPGYRPLEQVISSLAREGAPTRAMMTLGLVVFGLLLSVWAGTLARELGVPTLRPVVTVASLATLAVAALPLTSEGGQGQDTAHAAVAATGYVAFALTPLLAARALRGWARTTSVLLAVMSALALTASIVTGSGALQRLGLTVVQAWHVALASAVLRGRRP